MHDKPADKYQEVDCWRDSKEEEDDKKDNFDHGEDDNTDKKPSAVNTHSKHSPPVTHPLSSIQNQPDKNMPLTVFQFQGRSRKYQDDEAYIHLMRKFFEGHGTLWKAAGRVAYNTGWQSDYMQTHQENK